MLSGVKIFKKSPTQITLNCLKYNTRDTRSLLPRSERSERSGTINKGRSYVARGSVSFVEVFSYCKENGPKNDPILMKFGT